MLNEGTFRKKDNGNGLIFTKIKNGGIFQKSLINRLFEQARQSSLFLDLYKKINKFQLIIVIQNIIVAINFNNLLICKN